MSKVEVNLDIDQLRSIFQTLPDNDAAMHALDEWEHRVALTQSSLRRLAEIGLTPLTATREANAAFQAFVAEWDKMNVILSSAQIRALGHEPEE